LSAFYGTLAGICFGLLGLWWAVVQFRQGHDTWLRSPARRRTAYDVSLYFLLPGAMSLIALVSETSSPLWNVGFAIAALVGVAEAFAMLVLSGRPDGAPVLFRLAPGLALVLYAGIALLALFPGIVSLFDRNVQPIQVEGVLATILIFAGVNFAWLVFTEPLQDSP
jgi:hypothetical protein